MSSRPLRTALVTTLLFAAGAAHGFTQRSPLPEERSKPALTGLVRSPDAAGQARLEQQPAWRAFIARHGSWQAHWNERSATPHRAYGRAIPLAGYRDDAGVVDQTVRGFITANQEILGGSRTLETVNVRRVGRVWYVRYRETVRGIPVLFQDWEFRVDRSGRLMAFGVDAYPVAENVATDRLLTPALARSAATSGMRLDPRHRIEGGERLWLVPVPDENGVQHRLAAEVQIATEDPSGRWIVLVDARNGEVLWRHDRVRHAVGGTVTGNVHLLLPTETPTSRPFAHQRVTVGGGADTTDPAGMYSVPAAGTVIVNTQLRGPFCAVTRQDGFPNAAFADTVDDPATVDVSWAAADQAERDAFYHVNLVHDWVKAIDPDFTGNDYPRPWVAGDFTAMPCAVNVGGSCNAFWDGDGVNFFRAGGGCPNMATLPDVVYHEYGHGVNDNQYSMEGAPFGMTNGALHEGMADVLAALVQDNPDGGKGFFGPGTILRTLDNTRRWPQDASGDGHITGLIIGGAFWDLRQAIGLAQTSQLAHFARYGTPDDSDDGVAMNEYFVETLVADDNDGNLGNGTPNDDAIATAFNAHGIGTGFWIQVVHTPLADQASFGPYPVTANVTYTPAVPLGSLATPELHWSTDGVSFSAVPMTPTGSPNEFTATIPTQHAAIVRYFIRGLDTQGGETTHPLAAPAAATHTFIAGPAVQVFLHDLEVAQGWSVGAVGDNAVSGVWVQAEPVGTDVNGVIVQPDFDHTPNPGALCFVTGNAAAGQAAGTNDVDGGRTTLHSATFDASSGGLHKFIVEYYRWYSNNLGASPGLDYWRTRISNDGGTSWTPVENTQVSHTSWQRIAFFVSDVLTPTATMRMQFVAADSGDGSLVEAAVDDFRLVGFPAPTGVEEPAAAAARLAVGPSPFASRTVIRFGMAAPGTAALEVFDVRGRRVRDLLGGTLAAGHHQIGWDGRDARGERVPAGVYLVRLRTPAGEQVCRALRVE
jgi:Zn-dependent metalloprotease